jgi:hypothetical protein
LPDTPALVKRSTSRTWRIAVLSAGIRSPSAKAQGDPKRAGRGAVPNALYPGDIIPERQAKSSRNAERHHLGLAGDIIPDSRATSPGISTSAGAAAAAAAKLVALDAKPSGWLALMGEAGRALGMVP